MQLCEAGVRRSLSAATILQIASLMAASLGHYLDTLCCNTTSDYGAFLEVANDAAAAAAAGISTGHAKLQFASLCCSTLKAAAAASVIPGADIHYADSACLQVTSSLLSLLQSRSSASRGEFVAASDVPWLAISGRVLQYVAGRRLGAAAAASAVQCGQVSVPRAVHPRSAAVFQELQMMCVHLCNSLDRVLSRHPVSQQLSAAGYDAVSLQQQLAAFLQSLPGPREFVSLSVQQAVALQAVGLALTNVAFPCACNNPSCSELAGPLELQLVNRRSCMCADCRVVRYCSRDCQRRHWKQHKPVCHAIAARQAGAASATAAQSVAAKPRA